jgi:hypothetical protein
MEITKSDLIKVWSVYCEDRAFDSESFLYENNSQYLSLSLKINDILSITLFCEKDMEPVLFLSFYDIIRYKSFTLDTIEYEALSMGWEAGRSKAFQSKKNRKIKYGIEEFEKIFNQL